MAPSRPIQRQRHQLACITLRVARQALWSPGIESFPSIDVAKSLQPSIRMPLKTHCTPRDSVFAGDRRATVLSLDTFLKGKVHGGEFFDENYFTNGMTTLVDRAFRHLSGTGAGSSVFLLSQAMGGGKTHSMIGLGLLARDPALRRRVLADKDPAPKLGRCRVVGFNGRSTDAPGGIWGSIAEQLNRAEQFARYVSPLLSAPGPEAWKQLLGGDPLVLFLDELPPYLEYAVAVPVGNADLGVVTTTALANLFVAVAEMDTVCLVLSDLAGTHFSIGQANLQAAFGRAVQGISAESKRIAVPITPVNPNGDELYHILRKRLFKSMASQSEVERVAAAYRDALRDAARMNLTSTTPESLYSRVTDAYPFHPDLRELVGKFKENDGFQQTRGVIRLMQMVVADLWNTGKAAGMELIHPYDIDLNVDEIASEVRTINPSLSEAIAHDIAHGGDAEVEQIDLANGNADASEAARLILVASLSTTPGAIHGLREYQLVDCLQRPGRDLSTFKANVLDKLATRAWYLHNSADGRLFFKNQQNLAAKLRATAQSLHAETVDRMLREHLEQHFAVSLRDCYQVVKVLPPPDEVQVEQERTTLVVVRPGMQANQLPISADWQAWWEQQQYKNRVLFLTGSRDTFQKVIDAARQTRALQSIEDELNQEKTPVDDPQWRALDGLRDRIALQFSAALKEAFDQIVYPSINTALRATGVDLAFAGNSSGEATIRKTLEGAQKFTTKIDDDAFRSRAEVRLFGSAETKVVLWSDFKRNAAVNTNWPLHKTSALDDLKAECVRRGLWREEGNHVRRGPFPPPTPLVDVRELSVEEDGDGRTYLKVEPLHAPAIVFETGGTDPTPLVQPRAHPGPFRSHGLALPLPGARPGRPRAHQPGQGMDGQGPPEVPAAQPRRPLRGGAARPAARGRHCHPLHHGRLSPHPCGRGHLRRHLPRARRQPRRLRHCGCQRPGPVLRGAAHSHSPEGRHRTQTGPCQARPLDAARQARRRRCGVGFHPAPGRSRHRHHLRPAAHGRERRRPAARRLLRRAGRRLHRQRDAGRRRQAARDRRPGQPAHDGELTRVCHGAGPAGLAQGHPAALRRRQGATASLTSCQAPHLHAQ